MPARRSIVQVTVQRDLLEYEKAVTDSSEDEGNGVQDIRINGKVRSQRTLMVKQERYLTIGFRKVRRSKIGRWPWSVLVEWGLNAGRSRQNRRRVG